MPNWPDLENEISAHTGIDFSGSRQRPLGGGCINDTYEISNDRHHFFIKLSTRDQSDMFSAEAAGLNEILESSSVRAPKPICWGNNSTNSYIVMEYIDLGSGTADTPVTLGHQLAKMHRTTSAQFGWYRNNTIGSTPQPNDWTQSWIEFYRKHRLGFQFSLAEHSGCGSSLLKKGDDLLMNLDVFFDDYEPAASLLHGDLWSGNYAADDKGQPLIYDPAVYYGDRETDLAMTELFGGFPQRFYAAYNDAYPLNTGYKTRKMLYNLYHILNHFNLFGGGYANQAENMVQRLLSEIR